MYSCTSTRSRWVNFAIVYSAYTHTSSARQTYFYNDDTFNFNYGQALSVAGRWKEAEEAFQLVQNETLKADYAYLSWVARCCADEPGGFFICIKVWFCSVLTRTGQTL